MLKALVAALAVAALLLPLALAPDLLAWLGLEWLFTDRLHRPAPAWLEWPLLIGLAVPGLWLVARFARAVARIERAPIDTL